MTDVLKEQRRDQVPPSGLHILQAIKIQCGRVEGTVETFLQGNFFVKLNANATVVSPLRVHDVAARLSGVTTCTGRERMPHTGDAV